MKNKIILISSIAFICFNTTIAQTFKDFLIDWSLFVSPYSTETSQPEDTNDRVSANVSPNEPMLVAENSEEYVWVYITAYSDSDLERPLNTSEQKMFEDKNKLKYLDQVKHLAQKKLAKMSEQFDLDEQFNNMDIADTSLDILTAQENVATAQELDFYVGESDIQKNTLVDSFKCMVNPDRYFFAIVNFVGQRIVLKSIGVCQRFFINFWSGESNQQNNLDNPEDQLIVFLMSISGKNRTEAQEIISKLKF